MPAVSVLAVAVLGGCGSTTDEVPAAQEAATSDSAGCAEPTFEPAETPTEVSLASGGVERSYLLHVGAAVDDEPAPLVVDLHGYLSGAALQTSMSAFGDLADEEGFVVATPQGSSDLPYWNAVPHDDLPDDIAFLTAVIDDVGAQVCVDLDRVHVVGFSNGAFLASLVACELSDRVASVAAVAGAHDPRDCDPERAVPFLAVHGTDDEFVSFEGGPNPALDTLEWSDESRRAFDGLPFADVRGVAAAWSTRNGCATTPEVDEIAPSVEATIYRSCDGGGTVTLVVVDGGGHTWPGSEFSMLSESLLGPTTEEIDGTEVVWQFFSDHPHRADEGTTDG
ncbi:MAG: hypothetical protein JJU45_04485 [Acidimicrobiia bacterium]|nr:hypothetical protein [Acidimicrobiia bacterium]